MIEGDGEVEVQYIHLSEIDSTNSFLKEWLVSKKLTDPIVVSTDRQLAGRGQRGNTWHSEPGKNLTFSIAVNPNIPAGEQFWLNQAVSVAIVLYLSSLGIEAKVKWPNDIYVGDRKIAGILIENLIRGQLICQTVVGIGLNVNQQSFLIDNARPVSLSQLLDKKFNLKLVLEELSKLVIEQLFLFKKVNMQALYHLHLYGKDIQRRFRDKDGRSFDGTIIETEPTGRLVIRLADGSIKKFVFKEIEHIFVS